MGNLNLNQMACVTTADCAEVTDGCCTQWSIVSVVDDSYWGGFSLIWGGDEFMTAGASFTQCQSAAYHEARAALDPEAEFAGSNYEDLGVFLATADEETLEYLGLYPEDTVDDMIVAACVDAAGEDAASALVAASATLLAVALLN